MTPRCDDAMFRARGECIDTSAGPKNVTSRELLPDNLAQVPSERLGRFDVHAETKYGRGFVARSIEGACHL